MFPWKFSISIRTVALPNTVARRSCGRFRGQFQHWHHGAHWGGRVSARKEGESGWNRLSVISEVPKTITLTLNRIFQFRFCRSLICNSCKSSKFKESAHVCAVYQIGICPLWVFKGQQQEDEAATSNMPSGGVILSRPEATT